MWCRKLALRAGLVAGLLTVISPAHAQQGDSLREAAQNPVADLISLPFQNNTNFNVGQLDNTQNVLNIQPVIPMHLNPSWNLISRSILPVVYQPPLFRGDDTDFGLGDLVQSFFLSPKNPIPVGHGAGLVWGAGPAFGLPTSTDPRLGSEQWSAGPTFVALLLSKKVVTGFLINNLWSFAGDSGRADINVMTLQPFFNYNMPKGWYLTTSPIISANWEADSDNRWTLPIGGGVGRVFNIGGQPINAQITYYYNLESPAFAGGDSQLRAQWTFLFPTR